MHEVFWAQLEQTIESNIIFCRWVTSGLTAPAYPARGTSRGAVGGVPLPHGRDSTPLFVLPDSSATTPQRVSGPT